MAGKHVKYYFAFQSPFAALADTQIDDLVARVGATLEPIPVVPPPMPVSEGVAAAIRDFRVSYAIEDSARWAHRLGIPWKPPEPRDVDSTDASAGVYVVREHGDERAYRNAVFRARWSEGRNIGDRQLLAHCAEKAGVARDRFLPGIDDPRYRHQVQAALQRCMEDRIFGVPIFVVDGQRLWGNDRLDFLEEALK